VVCCFRQRKVKVDPQPRAYSWSKPGGLINDEHFSDDPLLNA